MQPIGIVLFQVRCILPIDEGKVALAAATSAALRINTVMDEVAVQFRDDRLRMVPYGGLSYATFTVVCSVSSDFGFAIYRSTVGSSLRVY
jgi:hypothetical protein